MPEKLKLYLDQMFGIEVAAALRRAQGPEIHGHVPEGAEVGKNYMGNVALVPGAFLKPNTRYRATAAVTIPGRRGAPDEAFAYEWEFETGRRSRK